MVVGRSLPRVLSARRKRVPLPWGKRGATGGQMIALPGWQGQGAPSDQAVWPHFADGSVSPACPLWRMLHFLCFSHFAWADGEKGKQAASCGCISGRGRYKHSVL